MAAISSWLSVSARRKKFLNLSFVSRKDPDDTAFPTSKTTTRILLQTGDLLCGLKPTSINTDKPSKHWFQGRPAEIDQDASPTR
jgi:hypothetical protein